jgi:NTE family protein
MKTGLVLGAGGMVGMSYHAGVLRALEVEGGFAPADSDLIIGTSAGSVVGAYLRSGWTTEDFSLLSLGTHPTLGPVGTDQDGQRPNIFAPTFRTPIDLARRAVGSAFVLGRSVVRVPLRLPPIMSRVFPGGFFHMAEGRRRFEEELPKEWPEKDLWLCAVDINSGRRVVLGRPGSPKATLQQGVLASTAIPGVYEPVKLGRRTLIDGGAHSTTNLDLAVKAGCELIICVAPMAFDTAEPPGPLAQLVRRIPARQLSGEVALARRRDVQVLMIRPDAQELGIHGINMMRPDGLDRIARAAYEATARLLTTDRFREALAGAAA